MGVAQLEDPDTKARPVWVAKNALKRETCAMDLGGVYWTARSLRLWAYGLGGKPRLPESARKVGVERHVQTMLAATGKAVSSCLTQVAMVEATDQGQLDNFAAVG